MSIGLQNSSICKFAKWFCLTGQAAQMLNVFFLFLVLISPSFSGPGTVFCDYLSYIFMFLSVATSNMVATSLAKKVRPLSNSI